MKAKILISFLILMLIVGCSADLSNQKNEIRFINGYVQNTNNNRITLRNGLQLRADQHVSAISIAPIYVVLDKHQPSGYAYFNGNKISVTLMKNQVQLSGTEDLLVRSTGRLKMIKSISAGDRIIQLNDGSKWYVPDEEEIKSLTNWEVDADVIIPDDNDRSKNNLRLINPYKNETLHVTAAENVTVK